MPVNGLVDVEVIKMVEYYYAGYIILESKKLGHKYINVEDSKDEKYFDKNRYYAIGEIINLTTSDDKTFTFEPTKRFLPKEDQRVINAQLESRANEGRQREDIFVMI